MDYIHTKPLSPGVEVTQQILQEISALSDQDKPDQAAMAMFSRAMAMSASGDTAGELAEYARLIARFGDSDHPELRRWVARAMYNRAVVVDESGNEAEALAEYARLIARFGDSDHPAVQELVACAMYNRAV
ncbi:hypothetical protein DU176_25120, partial [Salmonella enterica subsp. enterica serovar Poona]|nr:hypothetical protein [Salmonella enterica subsp. enterica serovar Richmond]EBY1911780.1 hypothetical protein [Salmonella enterica subsp. enterica serovar Poona]